MTALMDARQRPLPLSELLLPPEQAREKALQAGQLYRVVLRETADFGEGSIYSGASDLPHQMWPGSRVVEVIGSKPEVRRAVVGMFTEDCPEIIIRSR